MIRQIETKLISVSAIEMGHRDRQPSEAEVDRMANSVRQDGLLAPIGVQTNGESYRLVYGATRLAAVKKLGSSEVPSILYEGTPEEFASAEIIENLERRHLDKDEREQLTKTLVDLRAKEIQSELRKELDDDLSHNSSQEPKAHPKTKVEGSKRGRPATAEGKAKREVADETGQSLRNLQRITSEKPKSAAPRKTAVAVGEPALKEFTSHCARLLQMIKGAKPDRFIKTGLEPDDIDRLATYLSGLADLKSSRGNPTTGFVSQGNDVDPVSSGKSMMGAHEANEAQDATSETDPTTDEATDEQQDSDNRGGENVESAGSLT